MKNSLQIALLALTAGGAFALGWTMRSGGSDSAESADPVPTGTTKTNRMRSTDSGRMAGARDAGARAEDEFIARFKIGSDGISGEDMGVAIKEMMSEDDPLLRRKLFTALLDELTPENAKAAFLALSESRRGGPGGFGRGGDTELALLANAWGRIDGAGAVAALAEMRAEREAAGEGEDRGGRGGRGGDRGPGGSTLVNVLAGWATADGAAATAYFSGIEDQREKQMAGFGVLRGMLVNGTDEAMGFIQSIPATEDNGRTRTFYMSMVAGEMLEQGVDAAKNWVGTISDPELRGGALSRVVEQIAREDLEDAVAWVSQYAGDESAARAVSRVADRWASSDPQAALAWAESLPEATQAGVYSQAFDEWTRKDPVAAGEYLQNMQASAGKDAAVESYATELARSEPASAITWAESISDPETRNEALTDVARRWYRSDQTAASEWLAASGLPEESVQSVTEGGGDDRRGPGGRGGRGAGGGRGGR